MSKLFVICASAILVSACAGQAKLDRQADTQLSRHHTTCLKQGLAVDVPEHTACVADLYAREREQRAATRELITPKKSGDSNTASGSAERDDK